MSTDSYGEQLCLLTTSVEQLDMAGHRFGAAGTVPALRTAQVGEVVAGHRHVLVTLEAMLS